VAKLLLIAIVCSVFLSGCGGLYATACGGRAVLKSANLSTPNYHLTYKSAECATNEEGKCAKLLRMEPRLEMMKQRIHVDMSVASPTEGTHHMIILKDKKVIGRSISGTPYWSGKPYHSWRTSMLVVFDEPVELPISVEVVNAAGCSREFRYVIKPYDGKQELHGRSNFHDDD